jgi:hypothetical protein
MRYPISIIFILFIFFSTNIYANACETRASWINSYTVNRSDQNTVRNNLLNANLNTLLVLAPPIGNNKGWSDPVKFLNFIQWAKNNGFSVHIWVSNYHRIVEHADFTSPAEQQAQADWALSLLQTYGSYTDGIHFDYIRYPTSPLENRLDPDKMNGITETVRLSHETIKNHYSDKVLTAAVFNSTPNSISVPETCQFIPVWFKNWLNAGFGGGHYNLTCGIPNHMQTQQNPVDWVKLNYIDGIIPMMYYLDDAGYQYGWNDDAKRWDSFFSFLQTDRSKIYMGIGYFTDDPSNPRYGYDPAGVVRKIKFQRTIGQKGISIFEFSHHDTNDPSGWHNDQPLVDALTVDSQVNNFNAPYKESVQSCLSPNTPTPTPPLKPGDANGDGLVNEADYGIWHTNYNQNHQGPSYGDFDSDGVVDGADYVIWLNNYGH